MRQDAGTSAALTVGLIGFGFAGRVLHAPLIGAVAGLRLAAVVTRSPERVAEARAAHPDARVVRSVEALLVDAPDVVVIATPNREHAAQARASLEAGCAVVVDKPLATSAEEARALVALASGEERLLTVFHNRRWDGDFLTVRRLLEQGALGEVLRFESRFERWRPVPKPGWRRSGAAGEAGGLLYDLGSHLIDQALVLFGPVAEVYAELDRRPGDAVDSDTFVALMHVSGVRSHLWMSERAAQSGPRFRVLGSRAAYVKLGMDVQEAALRAGVAPGAPEWGEERPEAWGVLGSDEQGTRVPTVAGAWPAFYEELAAALRCGGAAPVDPRDAVAALEVIERAQACRRDRAS